MATTMLSACTSDFMKEYSQDLSRVQSTDDLNELIMGDCLLPKGLFKYSGSTFSYQNPNYAVLHFMGDEIQENLNMEGLNDILGVRNTYFPYFTWQQNVYIDYKGKTTLKSSELTYWSLAYEKINNCNMVIEAADELSVTSDLDKMKLRRIKGEARFLRAFYYLTLANLYGKPYAPSTASTTLTVPLKTSGKVENSDFTRASAADMYAQIAADLEQAEQDYEGNTESLSIYHASLDAIYILRSRVALYMQDWQTAETYAKKALDKNDFLQSTIGMNESTYPISSDNAEVIYSNGASCLGNMLYCCPGRESGWEDYRPVYTISDDLYNLYESNDSRKACYITTQDDPTNNAPTYHKINNSEASAGTYKSVSDVFSIRTAEAYLNMAEAEAQLGKDSEACKWLDKLRNKRIEGNTPLSLTGQQLVYFTRDERERELCLEGHRWFDLRRYMVDGKYPYSKEITHTMTVVKYEDWEYVVDHTSYYTLKKNDDAYTLDIPIEERDFQPSIGSNPRPVRNAVKTVTPND